MPKNNKAKTINSYYKTTDLEKGMTFGRYKEGRSSYEISDAEGISQLTVYCIIKKYETKKTCAEKEHPKTSKKLSPWAIRYLNQTTVCKYLHDMNLRSCVTVAKPYLDEAHKRACLQWKGGQQYVWCQLHEKYASDCLIPAVQWLGGSVSVWRCIWTEGIGPLVILDDYMTKEMFVQTLRNNYLSFLAALSDKNTTTHLLQEDNAKPHKSKLAEQWKKKEIMWLSYHDLQKSRSQFNLEYVKLP
ncbi:Homeodomain-like DNA binding domain-containing transcription factor [Phycomyces blakesleeanus NRRL 1555(-)]|uniref:Homeodomain-like DNA binding domain-containing transcription factor n=1 Tax=Phycomyces blakesleeanus (strain ATCC 8743b / DSM 1359 / FGSC 10004 / NBRC 33097 / NRRL 1555) TaxID=763407 RepID=A0A162TBK3_PHYB8|nr:Homeodomain-like DNA binding domain-containing transcription factor [Phycomyces blakesleeanus NRRL 1555(-)]OAD65783.1 Homeodomain-like DNA binding domain-containing transcription factor [Phycomyces blakesleeanus NRRL 1555(-)]|eukprot:XP_018283823.1 Homeodomain-like DNA binding domain-containing transcription factor [Phycomyces blakesleeanus NRRL 1555(-)]